jgi:hypothetical protein
MSQAQASSQENPKTSNEKAPEQAPKPKKTSGILKFIFGLIYVAFLIAIAAGILGGIEYYAYLQVKASPIGKAYQTRGLDNARLSTQKVAPQYGYEPTPGFAAVQNTNLGNSYEYINEESFKDFDEVPLDKPANEYRIIVTGGSVVYGRGPVPPADKIANYEVTFRWTIPHVIQEVLNADPAVKEKIKGKHIRVINAGVAGYVYQNNLMRYLAKLRLYRPDAIIALDGANEVHTVARSLGDWNYFNQGPYFEVVTDVMDMSKKGLMNYATLWLKRNTYFFTWLALRRGEGPGTIMEDRGFAAHAMDATPEMIEMRNRNIDQVADVMAIYHKTLETDKLPHVFALQPMFRNSKKPRMPIESRIEQNMGMEKVGFFNAKQTYEEILKRVKNRGKEVDFEVVDLSGIYDGCKEWVFTDWCHLTNGANYIMGKELANQFKTRVLGLPLAADDNLKEPYDAYFKDYAVSAKILVNGKSREGGTHILKGYPGKEVLEVAGAAEPASVTLDLGSVMPVSRLRLVWGDSQSVPKSWKMEISEDGTNWTPWVKIDETKTDNYDQWPGLEYYAGKESPARFVRYSQDEGKSPIKLRQVSLFR